MRKIEQIKEFILNEKEAFKDGLDISMVKRHYRKIFKMSTDNKDVVDALIELRKGGILENDFTDMKMKFVKNKKSK